MAAREYLEQIRQLEEKIRCKCILLAAYEANIEGSAGGDDGELVSHTRDVHAQQEMIANKIDLEDEINQLQLELAERKSVADGMIRLIPDDTYQNVLLLRYVFSKSWAEIAHEMKYNTRTVHKIKDRAFMELERISAINRKKGHIRAHKGT